MKGARGRVSEVYVGSKSLILSFDVPLFTIAPQKLWPQDLAPQLDSNTQQVITEYL